MNHAVARELLADYLEGDLSLDERAELDRHLAACPTCSEEVRSLRRVVGLLRALPDPELPGDLADRVMARIAAGEARPRLRLDRQLLRQGAVPRLVGTLAAGVAAALLVLSFRAEENGPVVTDGVNPWLGQFTRSVEAPGGAARATSRPSLASAPPGARTRAANRIRLARDARRIEPRVELGSLGLPEPRRTASAFGAWVAPAPEILDLDDVPAASEVDRQLAWLRRDPISFLRRTATPDTDRYSRLARLAASRGEASELAGRLMSMRLPEANRLASQMLFESLVADVARRQPPRD